jgi:phosphomannomutase
MSSTYTFARKIGIMTLIKSISGIRGTIGGRQGENLTPIDVVVFTSAFCSMLQERQMRKNLKIVVGRDARISGPMLTSLVTATASGLGCDVVDFGLSTTPTVEFGVAELKADGGIILTASHNPGHWNALKLLNEKGEFISASDGEEVLRRATEQGFSFASFTELGKVNEEDMMQKHINHIIQLPLVDLQAIQSAGLNLAIDPVNSSGAVFIPALLRALGVSNWVMINGEPNGQFAHNPEPLAEHLTEISSVVAREKCDLGIVVDPDVDRLAFVCEDGSMFGEEYTLVAIADYVLSQKKGTTVSNLSSTRALRDVTVAHGCSYFASAVGEVNVVEMMKKTNAVIGGEGNGGIIYPQSHYGRDALVGLALFLSYFAKKKMKASALRDSFPKYYMTKNKIDLQISTHVDGLLEQMKKAFPEATVNDIDGVKFDFANGWVHLRKSNTEPIIRIYSEAQSQEAAIELTEKVMKEIQELV